MNIFSHLEDILTFVFLFIMIFTLSRYFPNLSVLIPLFIGYFFVGFLGGVIIHQSCLKYNTTETVKHILSVFLVIGTILYISTYFYDYSTVFSSSIISTGILFFASLFIFLKVGFDAEKRFYQGKQPYQKYDWWPQKIYLIPLIPYYYFTRQKE